MKPPIITLQDKIDKQFTFKKAAATKAKINVIFSIIGIAAESPNLLCELRIEEKIDEILIRIRKGNIILAVLTSSLNFSTSFVNPGARTVIKKGIKISAIKTTKVEAKKKMRKILPANFWDSIDKLFLTSFAYIGTKAEFNAPSEKIRLNVFGNLKATKKISAENPVPK